MPFTRQSKQDQKEKQQKKEREKAEKAEREKAEREREKAEKEREKAEREKEKKELKERQRREKNSKKHPQDHEQGGAGVQLGVQSRHHSQSRGKESRGQLDLTASETSFTPSSVSHDAPQQHKGGASVAPAKDTKKKGGIFSRKSSTSSNKTPTPTSPREISPPPSSAKHPPIQPELGSSFECVPMPDDTLQNDPSLQSTSDQASPKTSGEQLQGSIRKDSQSKVTSPPVTHPLEVTQTSSVASPTSVSSTTEQGTSLDEVVFTMDDENGANVRPQVQPLNLTKDQIESLQREKAELVRRCSEAEENAKRIHQESQEQIHKLRAESEESRRSEIERILTDVTQQHKEEWKQRKTEMEKENEALIKRRKEEAEKEFEKSLQIKINNATRQVTAATGISLREKQKEIDQLKAQLAQTEAETKSAEDQEEEITRLKQLNKKSEEELAKIRTKHEKEMATKDAELKHCEMELHEKKEKISDLSKQVEKIVEDKRKIEEAQNHSQAEKKRLQQQLSLSDEAHQKVVDQKADLETKVAKIKQLEDELETEKGKQVKDLQQASVDHKREIEEAKKNARAELQAKVDKLEQQKMYEYAERRKQIKGYEQQIKKLKEQNEREKQQHLTVLKQEREQNEEKRRAEVKTTVDTAKEDMQNQQKSENLHEESNEKMKDIQDKLDAAEAETTFLHERIVKLEQEKSHLEEKYEQLQVVADMKHQMSKPWVESSVDQLSETPEAQASPQSPIIPSNVYHFSHQISKWIDPEAVTEDATEQRLSPEEVKAVNQAIGVQQRAKPPAYVFAVFAASNSSQSVLLDYSGHFQDREKIAVTEDDEEQFHSLDKTEEEEGANMTDAEKLGILQGKLEKLKEDHQQTCNQLDQMKKRLEEERARTKTVKDRFLDLHTQVIEKEENFKKKRKELHEKLEERDEEIKKLRCQVHGAADYPTVHDDGSLSPTSPSAEVSRLQKVIATKESEIERLRTRLETAKDEKQQVEVLQGKPEVVRRESAETAKTIETLQLQLHHAKQECVVAEHEKEHAKDELHALRKEFEAEKGNRRQAEATIEHLEKEVNKLQLETIEIRKKADMKRKECNHLNVELHRVEGERDVFWTQNQGLERQIEELQAREEERLQLKKDNDLLKDELEARKQEALGNAQDFEQEREDRGKVAGLLDQERAKWNVQSQQHKEERERWLAAKQTYETDLGAWQVTYQQLSKTNEDQCNKIKRFQEEIQRLQRKLENTEQTQATREKELNNESEKLQNELGKLHSNHDKLTKEFDQMKQRVGELEDVRDDMNEKLQLISAEKLSLEEQMESKKKEMEEQLDIKVHELKQSEEENATLKAQIVGLKHDNQESEKQLEGAIADTARLSDDIMAKTQQVKQYKKQNDSYKADRDEARRQLQQTADELQQVMGQLQGTASELERVKGQLHQTTKRMQECESQIQYYQTQLIQRDEDDTSKAAMQQAQWESEKLNMESQLRRLRREYTDLQQQSRGPPGSQLREVQKKYEQLRDRYNAMFKYNDQLQAILNHNQIPFPAPPKLSDATPPQFGRERVAQPDIPAKPILERGSQPEVIDPSTLPPAIDMHNQGNYGQPQYNQHGDPYNQPPHALQQHGQAYQPTMDPQYLAQPGGNMQGERLISGGLQHFQQQNPPMARPRSGSGGRQDTSPRLHHGQGRGRLVAGHDEQKSFTTGHALAGAGPAPVGVVPDYADLQSPVANKQQGQLINQQWNAPRSPSSAQYQQQYHGNAPQSQAGNVQEGQQPGYYVPQQQNFHGYQNVYGDPTQGLSLAPGQAEQLRRGTQQGGGQMGQVGSNQGYGGQASPNMQHQHQMPPQQPGQSSNYPPASVHGRVNQGMQQQPQAWQTQAGGGQMYGGHPQQPQGAAQGGNFVQPQQEMSHGQYQPQPNQPAPSQPPPNPSGPQENALMHGINTQIHEAAEEVKNEGEKSLTADAPLDPNLVCQMCQLQFKIGEIQKYKRHVATCKGSSAS